MTIKIEIIEDTNTSVFELKVNQFLKEWSYRIVSYTIGRNLIYVNHRWGRTTNVFRCEALFVVDDELPKESQRRIPPGVINNEIQSTSKTPSGIL